MQHQLNVQHQSISGAFQDLNNLMQQVCIFFNRKEKSFLAFFLLRLKIWLIYQKQLLIKFKKNEVI
jgi:hypothetical protein